MTGNAIAKEIVHAAFRIHTTLGPGLLESVYQTVLAYELGRRVLRTVSQALIKDGIARIVNGLQDDRAKSPSRKEAQEYLVSLSLGFKEHLGYK